MATDAEIEESDVDLTDAEYEEACRRGEEMRRNVPWAVAASYEDSVQRVLVRLSSGLELALPIQEFKFLVQASEKQRKRIELWAGGYEIYFPEIDEGIYVPHYLSKHVKVTQFLLEHPWAA